MPAERAAGTGGGDGSDSAAIQSIDSFVPCTDLIDITFQKQSVERALEKAMRCYGDDGSRLCDICRQVWENASDCQVLALQRRTCRQLRLSRQQRFPHPEFLSGALVLPVQPVPATRPFSPTQQFTASCQSPPTHALHSVTCITHFYTSPPLLLFRRVSQIHYYHSPIPSIITVIVCILLNSTIYHI
jgi:hypothetical protein